MVKSLLVIEAHEPTRAGIKRLLEMSGFRVSTAASEREAVRLSVRERFHLILLDANLPPPASLLAAHRLRGHSELRDAPVMVISVHDRAAQNRRALPGDFNVDQFTVGYVTDLCCYDELESLIYRVLFPPPGP